jgi:DNA-binding transcriptional LysR family regulator
MEFCIFAGYAMLDWDDLRFVLAVSRAGSALRAAHILKVNQTTVVRRLSRLEAAVGSSILERQQRGHSLTPLGERIAAVAQHLEREVVNLESTIRGERRVLAGSVRITTSEASANAMIAPFLKKQRRQHPRITVELNVDDRRVDIAGGEADLAVRAGSRPRGAGIVARRLPNIAWALYCGSAYVEEHGAPSTVEEINKHLVVGGEGAIARFAGPNWLQRVAPHARISTRSNSLTNLAQAVKAGLGVAVLPCIIADGDPAFVRCTPPIAELNSEHWLIVREAVKRAPHVRAVADLLVEHLESLRAELAGQRVKDRR